MPAIEFAVQDVHGAEIAARHGATRIELCSALSGTGGITPSAGLIQAACQQPVGVHVLIRPRAGGFYVLEHEAEIIAHDIRLCAELGAQGVVIGALRPSPTQPELDKLVLQSWIRIAQTLDLEVTIHRCVDVLLAQGIQPVELMNDLHRLGATRVLTSGGAAVTPDGIPVITELVEHSERNGQVVQVQAGGGVTIESIPALVQAGVHGIHLSGKTITNIAGPSGPGGGDATFDCTDEATIARVMATVAGPISCEKDDKMADRSGKTPRVAP